MFLLFFFLQVILETHKTKSVEYKDDCKIQVHLSDEREHKQYKLCSVHRLHRHMSPNIFNQMHPDLFTYTEKYKCYKLPFLVSKISFGVKSCCFIPLHFEDHSRTPDPLVKVNST